MAYFWWTNKCGEDIKVYFSQCKEGRWINDEKTIIRFDYLNDYDLLVTKREIDEDVWDMLLQVLNLEATWCSA